VAIVGGYRGPFSKSRYGFLHLSAASAFSGTSSRKLVTEPQLAGKFRDALACTTLLPPGSGILVLNSDSLNKKTRKPRWFIMYTIKAMLQFKILCVCVMRL
jgi:hypothetical protein